MPIEQEALFKSRDQIVASLISSLLAKVPSAYTGVDSNWRLLFELEAGQIEGLYVANQVILEDMFISTAGLQALIRHGEDMGVAIISGIQSTGSIKFSGSQGVYIPIGTEVAYDPGLGEESVLVFETTADGTIPSPGLAAAPTTVDSGTAGNLTGTFEYGITFITAAGETRMGTTSGPVVLTAHQMNLSAISIGGTGTTKRRIYRQKDGGGYKFVAEIANNTSTTYTDNITDGALGGAPPEISSAEAVTIAAEAAEPGVAYNIGIGAVNSQVDTPDGVSAVTNPVAFTGGADDEDMEEYRQRLLDHQRAPGTGSLLDMEAWAEEIEGVEDATAIPNDNVGTPTNGHVTVRISGPGGTVPGAPVIAAVLAYLESKDVANATIHVATFTAVSTAVTVALTLDTGYVLGDVTAQVTKAIEDYINDVPVGGTVYIAGIIDAVFGIPGIKTLTVSVPATDQTATATQKRTPGTITVT